MGPLSSSFYYAPSGAIYKYNAFGDLVLSYDPDEGVEESVHETMTALSERNQDLQARLTNQRIMVKLLAQKLSEDGLSIVSTTDMIEALREILDKTT